LIKDGASGNEGGLGILRSGSNEDQQAVLVKAASQGMGHGHFDRLNLLYYDNGVEIFPDYGSARFINIESKKGGDYLPENKTWAKQTIAHNTLTVDQTSNFKANADLAQQTAAEVSYFKADTDLQVFSAKESNAYPGIEMSRTTALLKVQELKKPLLVDIFRVNSEKIHQYDLPFWYKGNLVDASPKMKNYTDQLKPLGSKYGYEHLWLNAEQAVPEKSGYLSILNNKRFYTVHFATDAPLNLKLVSLGANDPDSNLLESKAFMLSSTNSKDQLFFSITESHGQTNPVSETTTGASSLVSDLKIISSNPNQASFSFKVKGKTYQYQVNYNNKENFIKIN
jgi:hypothetical protein